MVDIRADVAKPADARVLRVARIVAPHMSRSDGDRTDAMTVAREIVACLDAGMSWRAPSSRHFTRWGAYRARRCWVRRVPGRDAYVYRRGWFRWELSKIDYRPPVRECS